MRPIMTIPPIAAPTPMPAIAPVLEPPEAESLLLRAEADAEAEAETAAGEERLEVALELDTLTDAGTVLTTLGTV